MLISPKNRQLPLILKNVPVQIYVENRILRKPSTITLISYINYIAVLN